MTWVVVHYWEPRWAPGQPSKSVAGHSALETAGVYASWAPASTDTLASVGGRVFASPRTAYLADARLAGGGPPLHSRQVRLAGLDVAAIESTWRGRAAWLADPRVYGPPIAYTLVPGIERDEASSCATLILQLLAAGGSERFLAIPPLRIVTPHAVHQYALQLAAKLPAAG